MADNFYMTLPSNVASGKYFLQNTIANYTTKLPSHVSLDGKWEVGLAEISYTKSWYNIPKDHELQIWYVQKGERSDTILRDKETRLKRGFYNTIDDVIQSLNSYINDLNDLNNWEDAPQVSRNETNRLVGIKYGQTKDKRRLLVQFDPELCPILGFDFLKLQESNHAVMLDYITTEKGWLAKREADDQKIAKQNTYLEDLLEKHISVTADSPYDLSGGYHSLFVYCNVVHPSFVGDSYTQLLRIVEIPSERKFGEQVHLHYQNPFYIPLLTQEFETIEIDIKDETGESVPFEFGRSIVTLHFRRKSL